MTDPLHVLVEVRVPTADGTGVIERRFELDVPATEHAPERNMYYVRQFLATVEGVVTGHLPEEVLHHGGPRP